MNIKAALRILIFIAIVVGAFLLYRYFINRPDESQPSLVAAGFNDGPRQTTEFLEILLSLQKIELSGDLFTSSVFKSLTDFSVDLPDISPGRNNPYAPIGTGGRAGTSTSPVRSNRNSGGDSRSDITNSLSR